jgi:hypothetical protein
MLENPDHRETLPIPDSHAKALLQPSIVWPLDSVSVVTDHGSVLSTAFTSGSTERQPIQIQQLLCQAKKQQKYWAGISGEISFGTNTNI